MKKEYIKPEMTMEFFVTDSMLALSVENMGTNEKPGGPDDFNAGANRGEWGSLWKNGK
jgi:hypothetical protein